MDNLHMVGMEMTHQFQVIRNDRLHPNAGNTSIDPEAPIRHHYGIFWSKCQLTQASWPAPQISAFLQGGSLCQEGRSKEWWAPG
jgi:hypothetical protein